jgi:hypothetical protein
MAKKEEKKYKNTVKNREILEKESDKKKINMLKKMDSIDVRLKDKKMQSDKDKIKEREEKNVKTMERNIIIQRMLRVQDYRNKLKMEELEVKDKKIAGFKLEKERLALQKAQASTEIQKQKEELVEKFDKLVRQNKEIEPEMIKELFPGDNELYRSILEMKKKQKEIEDNIIKKYDTHNSDKKNKSMANPFYKKRERNIEPVEENKKLNKSTNDNDENEKQKKEQEIQKKVEEFKTKEYKEFNNLILEEKEKEEKRTKEYEEEKDEQKKLEIEKKNKEERELASENLNKTKNDIENRIKEYEDSLRKEA